MVIFVFVYNCFSAKHLTFHVPPSTKNVSINDLEIGTTYHIYVEAIFNQQLPGTADRVQLLKSWLMKVKTLGYGPANREQKLLTFLYSIVLLCIFDLNRL